MRDVLLFAVGVVGLGSCARGTAQGTGNAKAGPDAATVRVLRQAELVKDCEFLATVKGESNWGGTVMSKKGLDNAREEARRKAAGIGGDMLLLQTENAGGTGSTVTGDAYRCKAPAVEEPKLATKNASKSPPAVRVVRQAELVKDCEFLATVKGESNWGGTMMSKKGLDNAREEARRKAAEIGGDMLLLQTEDAGGTGSTVTGDAYRCSATRSSSPVPVVP